MDTRRYRLCQVSERTGHRCKIRWHFPGFESRWQLLWTYRQIFRLQQQLQDVLEAVLGSAGDHVREGVGVGAVDVEGGERGRLVVSGWAQGWVDSTEPDAAEVPDDLWVMGANTTSLPRYDLHALCLS